MTQELPSIKELVKDKYVEFAFYRAGFFYYNIIYPVLERGNINNFPGTKIMKNESYQFPVPIEDVGNATLNIREKAITFKIKIDMKYLTGWVFTYNDIQGQWRAAKREHYADLFNDLDSENVIRSSSYETLIDLIVLTTGDISRINTLITEYEPR